VALLAFVRFASLSGAIAAVCFAILHLGGDRDAHLLVPRTG
jgi:hypothetical protein